MGNCCDGRKIEKKCVSLFRFHSILNDSEWKSSDMFCNAVRDDLVQRRFISNVWLAVRCNQLCLQRCFHQRCNAQSFAISFVLSSESTFSKFCFVFRFSSSESLRKGSVQSCRHCSNRFHQPCGFSRFIIAGSSFPALCRSMQLHQTVLGEKPCGKAAYVVWIAGE